MTKQILSFCDASYCDATKAWGIGIWIQEENTLPTVITMGGKSDFNNNIEVEAFAIHTVIQQVRGMSPSDKVLTIYSDCKHALCKFSRDIITKDLSLRLCFFRHVRAHTKGTDKLSRLNRKVDRLANQQMRKHRNEI